MDANVFKRIVKFFVPYGILEHRRKILALKRGWRYDLLLWPLTPETLGKKQREFVFENEYIRASALDLIANEIYDKKIAGNVAELGVFQGDFAKMINVTFPDRKLYLFDTFEGFDKRDIQKDIENGFSAGFSPVNGTFSKTSVELVLGKMEYRENCVIRKGYFPETTEGISESFAFVSIDCDLYDPIYSGLYYFYEKLSSGGYLLVHDYNNKNYSGVKAALRRFAEEKRVSYFPLCDGCGSAVIMKP